MTGDRMHPSPDEVRREFDKFFNPARLRGNLLLGALYLATFEVLKSIIVDNINGFFALGSDYRDGKPTKTAEYRAALAKHEPRDGYRASCLWLQEVTAITAAEVEQLLAIRRHRNVVAHELPRVLLEAKLEVDIGLLTAARDFIHRLERWWFENYEATIDPEILGGKSPDQVEFISGRMAYIDHVIGTVLEVMNGDQQG